MTKKAVATTGNGTTLIANLPSDLGRVTGKGLEAMEAFLDSRRENLEEPAFRRALSYARIGAAGVGASIRYMAVLNNRAAIELARERHIAANSAT